MQEVYCRLLERGGSRLRAFRGRSEGEAASYLARIARHVVRDHVRGEQAQKRGGRRGQRVRLDESAAAATPDAAPSPEESLLGRERRRLGLSWCRAALGDTEPARNLRIFRLAVLEGRSSREIATMLGGRLAPSSVDSVLYRLKLRLLRAGVELPAR